MAPKHISEKEILSRLVAFDTTSRNTNLPLIDYVKTYLEGYGITSTLVPNEEGDKASLFATIGPDSRNGIGLSAHTDVVPVDGQTWSSDPFELTEKDGALYGRGACDMKGFIACVLAAVPDFISRDFSIPIHLIFSYDEEIGCTGVRPLIAELGRKLTRPRMVIVGEPTSMQTVDAHKSINAFVTEVTGQEAHSSVPHLAVNAVMIAAQLITELHQIGEDVKRREAGERFDPPYTSVHVGKIEGGTALNIVPKQCHFIWEFRGLPEFDEAEIPSRLEVFAQEKLLPKMHAVSTETGIETQRVNHVPAFQTAKGTDAISLVLKLAQQNETYAVSYGTEAGLFELGGCPTVICGPGNIEQAHKPDEFVTLEQLELCSQFLRRLGDYVMAG